MSTGKKNIIIDSIALVSRIREACKIASDKELAEILGFSQEDFSARKRRGSILPFIIEYAINNNVDLNWLITGRGIAIERKDRAGYEETKCLDAEEYELIPMLQSWVKGGPEGRLIYEGIADYYPFKRYFVEKLVGTRPERKKDLYLARVRGDSMAPTINDNEIVLFDTYEGERLQIRTGDIYLVLLPEGTVSVKRLALSKEPEATRLICNSDNVASYRTFEFKLDPGKPIQSYVLGRVRWAGKEFD